MPAIMFIPKKKTRVRFKTLAKLVCLVLRVWRIHSLAMHAYLQQAQASDLLSDKGDDECILFDITKYKADKQPRLSAKAIRILKKWPADRSQQEIGYVQIALWTYKALAEYPLHIQRTIAARAWIESYTPNRVIVRQGHSASCFYFILSGLACGFVTDATKGLATSLTYYSRGDSFGDAAIVNATKHQCTLISKGTLQLLVLTGQDYLEVFMSGGFNNAANAFLNSLSFLDGWPKQKLDENPKKAVFGYYRRGTVLVPDSSDNDWLIIVKSGSCTLFKKFTRQTDTKKDRRKGAGKNVRERLQERMAEEKASGVSHEACLERMHQRAVAHRGRRGLLSTCSPLPPISARTTESFSDKTCRQEEAQHGDSQILPSSVTMARQSSAKLVTSCSGSRVSIESQVKKRSGSMRTRGALVVKGPFMARKESSPGEDKAPEHAEAISQRTISSDKPVVANRGVPKTSESSSTSVFVSVQTLTKGMVFGLTDVFFQQQPSMALVSNGAECILVSKKFYLEHASHDFLARVGDEVFPYPSEEDLQRYVDLQLAWDAQRRVAATRVWREIGWAKSDKNDSRLRPPRVSPVCADGIGRIT